MSFTTDSAVAVVVTDGLHADHKRVAPLNVHTSYDGSNVVFRLLRMETWDPSLMNLGYHTFRGPLAFLNVVANLEMAQRRLAPILRQKRRERCR